MCAKHTCSNPGCVVGVGRAWVPFASSNSYRQSLLADTLESLPGLGTPCAFATPLLQDDLATTLPVVQLPEWLSLSRRRHKTALLKLWYLARNGSNEAWWHELGSLNPTVFVALNPDSIPVAWALAQTFGAQTSCFDLGGVDIGFSIATRNIVQLGRQLLDFILPLHMPLDSMVHIEDTTNVYKWTPAADLPPERILRLGIPRGKWRAPDTPGADLADLPSWPGMKRMVWAGRAVPDKRPEFWLKMVERMLEKDPDVQAVMVGPVGRPLKQQFPALFKDGEGDGRRFVSTGLVGQDRLHAILQSATVAVFCSAISVAGVIFRESVAHGVPVACTCRPDDLMLYSLLEPHKHIVQLDPRDVEASSNTLIAAVQDGVVLEARAVAAREAILPKVPTLPDFVEAASHFLAQQAARSNSTR